jgi:hypothetical protein
VDDRLAIKNQIQIQGSGCMVVGPKAACCLLNALHLRKQFRRAELGIELGHGIDKVWALGLPRGGAIKP